MAENQPPLGKWLTLSAAAQQLGIHATTLRRWADSGNVPYMLTPGGHRRFHEQDIAQLAVRLASAPRPHDISQVWISRALTETRQQVSTRQDQTWLDRFSADSRIYYRQLGQRLIGLTLQFLSDDQNDEALLAEARKIGEAYAFHSMGLGLTLTAALQASMFFRETLVESALHLPDNVHVRSEVNLRLMRRINALLNAVSLTIAEVYDAANHSLHRS